MRLIVLQGFSHKELDKYKFDLMVELEEKPLLQFILRGASMSFFIYFFSFYGSPSYGC